MTAVREEKKEKSKSSITRRRSSERSKEEKGWVGLPFFLSQTGATRSNAKAKGGKERKQNK